MPLVPPVTLEPDTVAVVQDLLRSHPHFLLYFEAALSAPVDEKSNQKILVGMNRRGLALSIDFERVTRPDAQRKRAGRKALPKRIAARHSPRRRPTVQQKWAFPRAVGREGAEAGRSDSDQSQVRALAGD